MENNKFIKYQIFFELKNEKSDLPQLGKNKEDLAEFIDKLGVQIKTFEICQKNLKEIQVDLIALYAWKLVILDRSFNEGAKKIIIVR